LFAETLMISVNLKQILTGNEEDWEKFTHEKKKQQYIMQKCLTTNFLTDHFSRQIYIGISLFGGCTINTESWLTGIISVMLQQSKAKHYSFLGAVNRMIDVFLHGVYNPRVEIARLGEKRKMIVHPFEVDKSESYGFPISVLTHECAMVWLALISNGGSLSTTKQYNHHMEVMYNFQELASVNKILDKSRQTIVTFFLAIIIFMGTDGKRMEIYNILKIMLPNVDSSIWEILHSFAESSTSPYIFLREKSEFYDQCLQNIQPEIQQLELYEKK
jgi:hypothetical protein